MRSVRSSPSQKAVFAAAPELVGRERRLALDLDAALLGRLCSLDLRASRSSTERTSARGSGLGLLVGAEGGVLGVVVDAAADETCAEDVGREVRDGRRGCGRGCVRAGGGGELQNGDSAVREGGGKAGMKAGVMASDQA